MNALQWWPEEGVDDMDTWMHMLCGNMDRRIRMAEKRRGAVEVELTLPAQAFAFDNAVLNQIKGALKAHKHGHILTLYFLKEFSSKDIADQVRESHSNVRKIIQRFRQEMNRMFK